MHDRLAQEFETHHPRLTAAAYRMLGSRSEADDAVQEAWLRVSRAGADGIDNLGGWLTTVVARVCLDMLRSRTARREEPLDDGLPDALAADERSDPARDALIADALGPALLVVLDMLAPAERVAFVLHDLFGVPFEEIAPIVGRTPAAARQLASRARRRVHGAPPVRDADRAHQRAIVEAFLDASRGGRFDALLALLDPSVVLRADAATVTAGAAAEVRGAAAVAETFAGRARAAVPALIDGVPGLVWRQGSETRVVFAFRFAGAAITGIDLLSDPETLRALDVRLIA